MREIQHQKTGLKIGDLTLVPDGASSDPGSGPTYYNKSDIPPSTATMTINEDGSYTFGGDAPYVHMYYKNWTCSWDTMNDWVTNGTTIGEGLNADIHPSVWQTGYSPSDHQDAGPSYVIENFFDKDPKKLQGYVYNVLVTNYPYIPEPTPSPGPSEQVLGDIYAPDINITGALVVTDPNNLDGSGPPNAASGNIYVDLRGIRINDNGDFTLVHVRNYEDLLASQDIKGKIVVNTWEELK